VEVDWKVEIVENYPNVDQLDIVTVRDGIMMIIRFVKGNSVLYPDQPIRKSNGNN
jgi:hypothetical protein